MKVHSFFQPKVATLKKPNFISKISTELNNAPDFPSSFCAHINFKNPSSIKKFPKILSCPLPALSVHLNDCTKFVHSFVNISDQIEIRDETIDYIAFSDLEKRLSLSILDIKSGISASETAVRINNFICSNDVAIFFESISNITSIGANDLKVQFEHLLFRRFGIVKEMLDPLCSMNSMLEHFFRRADKSNHSFRFEKSSSSLWTDIYAPSVSSELISNKTEVIKINFYLIISGSWNI